MFSVDIYSCVTSSSYKHFVVVDLLNWGVTTGTKRRHRPGSVDAVDIRGWLHRRCRTSLSPVHHTSPHIPRNTHNVTDTEILQCMLCVRVSVLVCARFCAHACVCDCTPV